jgi:transposase
MIFNKRPEPLKLDFALWTRAAVMLLVERECGVHLAVRSVGQYLKRWGFTPQKPVRRAYEQSPVAGSIGGSAAAWALSATGPRIIPAKNQS